MGTITESETSTPSVERAVFLGQGVCFQDASWSDYQDWDRKFEALGFGRVSYCDGVLEIMSISKLHEKIKRILGRIIEDYAIHVGMNPDSAGSATIGDRAKDAGKEPDDSFWFDRDASENDPDLIVEVVVKSEAISKQNFYARFGIPELWVWENSQLTVYLLNETGDGYRESERSDLFPELDLAIVETCGEADNLGAAIREFQKSL